MKPITINFGQMVSSYLAGLGYVKAADMRLITPAAIFSGETYPGQENDLWSNLEGDSLYKQAVSNPWVYANIKLIADAVSDGVMRVQQRSATPEKWEDVEDHPFERVVEGRPNPHMSQSFYWRYQLWWLMLHGEAYGLLIPDGTGDLVQVYPLPANRVKPIPWSRDEMRNFTSRRQLPPSLVKLFAYTEVSGADPTEIPPEQIVFYRFPNPFSYYRGLSPLTAYRLGLMLDTQAESWDLEDYQGGLTLRHLVSLPAETNTPDFLRGKEEIIEGQRRGDRLLVTRSGDVKVQEIGSRRLSGQAGDTTREITRTEANYVFGIPDGLRDKNATQANADTADRLLKEKTIWPLMCLLAEDTTAQIVIPFYGDEYRAVFEDIRPVDRKLLMDEEDHQRKVMTYDEAREAAGLDPHPDPDIGNAPYPAAAEIAKLKVSMSKLPDPTTDNANHLDRGNEAGDDQPDSSQPDEAPEPDEAEKAKDLRRWQSVALRMWRRGEQPESYDFQSKHIAVDEVDRIRARLRFSMTEDDIKAVFIGKHVGQAVMIPCPFCAKAEVEQYPDHAGLCICKACGMTFDPEVESWQTNGAAN